MYGFPYKTLKFLKTTCEEVPFQHSLLKDVKLLNLKFGQPSFLVGMSHVR